MKSNGFFLLEILLYCFLMTTLCLVVLSITLKISESVRTLTTTIKDKRFPYAVFLSLIKDIEAASFYRSDWGEGIYFKKYSVSSNQQLSSYFSEWKVEKNWLVHKEYIVDSGSQKKIARSSRVLPDVISLTSHPHINSYNTHHILGTTLTLVTSHGTFEKTIVLKNHSIL